MPYNGSGVFSLVAGNPVVTGTIISSTWANNTLADIANNGLSSALTKDGQQTPTANIPFGGFRATGVGNAAARTDAPNAGQIQDAMLVTLNGVTGTDTITATSMPAITAYTAGQRFQFLVAGSNTTNSVTLNINALGAKSITKNVSNALGPGDMAAGSFVTVVYDGTQFQLQNVTNFVTNPSEWNVLLNPEFRIWETGTAFTMNPAGAVYVADIWIGVCGTSGAGTVQQVASIPGDPLSTSPFNLRFNQTSGAGQPPILAQHIESVRTLNGQYVTATFTGSVTSGTLVVTPTLTQFFGAGGSASVTTTMPTFTLTTTEATYSSTVFLPSISGKTLGTPGTDSLFMQFNFPTTTVFTGNFVRAQLGPGTIAPPFQSRPFNLELQAIQRFIEVIDTSTSIFSGGRGWVANNFAAAQSIISQVQFKATKRASPTMTAPTGSGNVRYVSTLGVFTGNSPNFIAINTSGFNLSCNASMAGAAYGFIDGFGPIYADARM